MAWPIGIATNGWFQGGLYPATEIPPKYNGSMMLFNLTSDPYEHYPL